MLEQACGNHAINQYGGTGDRAEAIRSFKRHPWVVLFLRRVGGPHGLEGAGGDGVKVCWGGLRTETEVLGTGGRRDAEV